MIGVESKFSEPFSARAHSGLKPAYLEDSCDQFWLGLPKLRRLAEKLCPENHTYDHLDAAQLLKHILGLGRNTERFHLLYLYYAVPVVPVRSTPMTSMTSLPSPGTTALKCRR